MYLKNIKSKTNGSVCSGNLLLIPFCIAKNISQKILKKISEFPIKIKKNINSKNNKINKIKNQIKNQIKLNKINKNNNSNLK